jgi:hypothetical protein
MSNHPFRSVSAAWKTFPEHLWRSVVNRVRDLVRFLDHVLPEGLERLLAIPRAAVRTEQCAHQLDEAR